MFLNENLEEKLFMQMKESWKMECWGEFVFLNDWMCSNYPPTRNYCKELGINGPLGGTAFQRSAVIYTAFYESLLMFVICYLFFQWWFLDILELIVFLLVMGICTKIASICQICSKFVQIYSLMYLVNHRIVKLTQTVALQLVAFRQ